MPADPLARLDRTRIALGVRQPWCELILRGVKTLEIRSRDITLRGPIYLYSAKKLAEGEAPLAAARRHGLEADTLPRGVIVGEVTITGSRPATAADEEASCVPAGMLVDRFAWGLEGAERLDEPVKPRFLPYGVWFYPFTRKSRRTSSETRTPGAGEVSSGRR